MAPQSALTAMSALVLPSVSPHPPSQPCPLLVSPHSHVPPQCSPPLTAISPLMAMSPLSQPLPSPHSHVLPQSAFTLPSWSHPPLTAIFPSPSPPCPHVPHTPLTSPALLPFPTQAPGAPFSLHFPRMVTGIGGVSPWRCRAAWPRARGGHHLHTPPVTGEQMLIGRD